MKKITSVFLTIMVACMVLGGCTKDKVSLHARFQRYTPQSDSKVYMDDLTPRWNDGDTIKVNNQTATVSSSGYITEVDDNDDGYGLFYPAAWAGTLTRTGGTITIPASQIYSEDASGNQIVLSPMAAQAYESTDITMHNVCGLLRLNVTNNTGSAMKVNKIVLIDEESAIYLSGVYNLALNPSSATLTYQSGGGHTVTLDCSTAAPTIASGSSKYFYVSVPAFNNNSARIRVKVYTNVGGYEYLFNKKQNADGAHALAANQIGPILVTISSTSKTGAMCGAFSVNGSGKKVQFSCGNLRYNTSTSAWSFADNQYDIVGGSTQPNGNLIDLFGWATGNAPTDVSNTAQTHNIDGTEYDWSQNTITGSTGRTWSLLSCDEWNYLLNNTGRGDTRFVLALVNGQTGLVIFPDNYSVPSGITLRNVNETYNGNTWTNDFNTTNWATLQASGAVFLPEAGFLNNGGSRTAYIGLYWTGAYYSGTNSWTMRVAHTSGTSVASRVATSMNNGCSVRPVTVVQ